jgi:hypothetical protein
VKEIVLKNGEKVFVDDEDFERVDIHNWHLHSTSGYPVKLRHKKPRQLRMSRFVLDYFGDLKIDHIDGNKLNNQKSNLRIVTITQNNRNRHGPKTSTYIGVSRVSKTGMWLSYIWINKKQKTVGLYRTEEEAKIARDNYIIKNNIQNVGIVHGIDNPAMPCLTK